MKKFAATLLFAGLALVATPAFATQDADLHCPDGGVKVEANGETQDAIDSLVLDAGTVVCVKAGPGNTGKVVADGEDTLRDILKDAGIVGGNGEGRNVSYYVVYETPTTTTTQPPTTTTTAPPVTTTTAPPVTTTTAPPVVEQPKTVAPPAAPPAAPPVAAPTGQLPHTGAGWGILAVIGAGLGIAGLILLLLGELAKRRA